TEAERELRRAEAEAAHKPREPIENLRYTIETWSAGGNVLEVLGRDALVTPATAAYQAYVDHYPERLIIVRQGGQIIRRSDRDWGVCSAPRSACGAKPDEKCSD